MTDRFARLERLAQSLLLLYHRHDVSIARIDVKSYFTQHKSHNDSTDGRFRLRIQRSDGQLASLDRRNDCRVNRSETA